MTATLSKEIDLPEIHRPALRGHGSGAGWQLAKAMLGVFALGLAFYGFWRIRGMYLSWADNADVLYLADLYRDLVSHHYPLTGWRLTPAPYFFPDMPLFFLSAAVTPNLPSAYCLYAGIMLLAIFGCMYWIASAISASRADRLLAVGMAALLMFLLALSSRSYWVPMRWLLAPSGHSGSLLCGLILIALSLDLMRRPTRNRLIAFASISFIALASDQLLLGQFIAPIIGATLIWAFIYRSRQQLTTCTAITASSLIAWRAAIWLVHSIARGSSFQIPDIAPALAPSSLIAHWWPQVKQDWHEVAAPTTPLFLVTLASLVAVVMILIHLRSGSRRARTDRAAQPMTFITWVAIASLLLSFGVPVLTSMWGNIDCFRYELSFLVLPLLLLTICFVYWLRRLPGPAGTGVGLSACAIGMGLCLPVRNVPAFENTKAFYPPTVAAFDQLKRQYGLHAGFSDYWLSRSVAMLSREHLLMSPVEARENTLSPTLWIDNPNHWCQSPEGKRGEYPIYDFAVCTPTIEAKIRERCGAPAKVVECAKSRVLIYNRPTDVLFRSIGRAEATTAADAPLASRVVKIRFLNHAKPLGYLWAGPDTKILRPGQRLELRLDKPIAADVLSIAARSGMAYQIELKMGEKTVGNAELKAIGDDNLQPYDFLLTPITGGREFDQIIITAGKEADLHSIGSVMAFADPLLHPR